ncbi:MAG: hypothetical protein OEM19_07150 [Deltaproteobacteria bacterium]|nr:hypothetical protein [Deltaproteobacteria bacterium]
MYQEAGRPACLGALSKAGRFVACPSGAEFTPPSAGLLAMTGLAANKTVLSLRARTK